MKHLRISITFVVMALGILLPFLEIKAQHDIEEITQIHRNHHLHDFQKYLQLKSLEKRFARSDYYYLVTQKYASVFGDHEFHERANRKIKEIWQSSDSQKASGFEFSKLDDYVVQDAEKVIDSLSARYRVIFFNELQTEPPHRKLLLHLLEKLYSKGYRYLLTEDISQSDYALSQRGYPLIGKTGGIYIQEPVYGELIRKAIKLGFSVRGYDFPETEQTLDTSYAKYGITFEGSPYKKAEQVKEWNWALSIYHQTFKVNPSAKVIVLAGKQHAYKNPVVEQGRKYWTMGALFQKLSRIQPLVIDQSQNVNLLSTKAYKDFYESLVNEHLVVPETAVCFTHKVSDELLSASVDSIFVGLCDLTVFHPYHHRIDKNEKRIEWMVDWIGRTLVRVSPGEIPKEIRNGKEPYLLQAFYFNEPSGDAIPVDQVIVQPDDVVPPFLLPNNGDYFKFSILTAKGKRFDLTYLHPDSLSKRKK